MWIKFRYSFIFSHILEHFNSFYLVIWLLVELAGNHIAARARSLVLPRNYTQSLLFLEDISLWSIFESESLWFIVLGSRGLLSRRQAATFPTLAYGSFWLIFQVTNWVKLIVLRTRRSLLPETVLFREVILRSIPWPLCFIVGRPRTRVQSLLTLRDLSFLIPNGGWRIPLHERLW